MNQPLNAAIQTSLGQRFFLDAARDPATANRHRWQFAPNSVLRAGFGIFSDILPGSIADVVGMNPPYVKTFQGGLLGTAGGTAIAPGVPNSAVDATVAANQSFHPGISAGPTLLRLCAGKSCNVSSARRHYRSAEWRTPRALFHGVEPWPRASVRNAPAAFARNTWARAR